MKRAIKIGLALVMIISVVSLGLTGCAQKAAPTPEAPKVPVAPTPKAAPEKVYKVKLNLVTPTTSYGYKETYLDMKADVEKRSNGRLIIDIYPNQALINMHDVMEGLSRGIADLSYEWTSWYDKTFPYDTLYAYPYKTGMRQYNAIMLTLREKYGDEQWKHWPQLVDIWDYTCRPGFLFTVRKPVYKYEDIKGMSLFTITPPDTQMYTKMGATVIGGWAGAEQYELMSKGAIEGGYSSPGSVAFGYKFYELGKPGYLMDMGGTGCGPCGIAAYRPWWESLPKDLQQILMDSIRYHGDASGLEGDMLQYTMSLQRELEAYEFLKTTKVVIINWTPTEVARFRKDIVTPMWEAWAKWADGLGFRGTEYMNDYERLIPEMNKKYPLLKEFVAPAGANKGKKMSTYVEQTGDYIQW